MERIHNNWLVESIVTDVILLNFPSALYHNNYNILEMFYQYA